MKDHLTSLRQRGVVKPYQDPVTNVIEIRGYVLSYCIEDAFGFHQATLGVSRGDHGPIGGIEPELAGAITEVFGLPRMVITQHYQKRGETRLFVF